MVVGLSLSCYGIHSEAWHYGIALTLTPIIDIDIQNGFRMVLQYGLEFCLQILTWMKAMTDVSNAFLQNRDDRLENGLCLLATRFYSQFHRAKLEALQTMLDNELWSCATSVSLGQQALHPEWSCTTCQHWDR